MSELKPVILVVRDPDWETEVYLENLAESNVQVIIVDMGASFNGTSGFYIDDVACREWAIDQLVEAFSLPVGSKVRARLAGIVETLVSAEDYVALRKAAREENERIPK